MLNDKEINMINQMPDGPLSQQGGRPTNQTRRLGPDQKEARVQPVGGRAFSGPLDDTNGGERPSWIHLSHCQKQVAADQQLSRLGGGV